MPAPWPQHPLFCAETKEEAQSRLELFGDGIIVLSEHQRVLSANSEAIRMLGLPQLKPDCRLNELSLELSGWQSVLDAVERCQCRDVGLRGAGGRSLLVTLVSSPEADHIQLIFVRDVEAYEFRRDRAFGYSRTHNVRFLSSERTRPDFAAQRRLCPAINRLLSRGERAIRQGARILITGESGVGKSEIARFLHSAVADARDPFVVVNCASSSEAHFEALLFGHEDVGGQRRAGLIEQAEGGTLFLDEVAEIPLSVQAKLLGYLEDGRLPDMGAAPERPRYVRIVSATNRDIRQMVRDGKFRADLYFRIAVVGLPVPPLRDLAPLIDHLIDRFSQTINQRRQLPMMIPKRLREILNDYSFPGNIRELLNIVQRIAVFLEDSDDIDELVEELLAPLDIPGTDGGNTLATTPVVDLRTEVRRFERALIDKAIRIHGSKRKAAKALGVDIGTVVRKTAETASDESSREFVNRGNRE